MADPRDNMPVPPASPEDNAPAASGSLRTASMPDIQNLFKAFGQIISNTNLYSHSHKVTRQASDAGYALLTDVLSRCDVISLTVAENNVLADGRPVEIKNPLVAAFSKQIVAIEVSGLSFKPGMPRDEFDKLLELLSTQPEKLKAKGQFAQVLAASGIQHAQARTAMYQLVTEEDVVVNKGELQQALGGTGGADSAKAIEEIHAFLKGELNIEVDAVARNISEISTDPGKLAELILQAAEAKRGTEGAATLADTVVDCLRRTFDSLMQDPASKTQQGKRHLQKILTLLEKDVLDKLRAAGAIDAAGVQEIEEAVEEMSTELQMDALAGEYVKKRKGIEAAEKKILRFLKTRGSSGEFADELKDKLEDGGLTPDDWKELVVKSGAKIAAGEEPDIGALTNLLSHLDDVLKAGEAAGAGPGTGVADEAMAEAVAQISHEVATVSQDAEQRIQELVEKIGTPPDESASLESQIMSRREMIELLAEIVQELNQPLAVITASLEMMVMKRLGAITEPQKEMLELAVTSAERLKILFDKLLEISGVPLGRNPDAKILDSIYRKE